MNQWIGGVIFGIALGLIAFPMLFLSDFGKVDMSEVVIVFFVAGVTSYFVSKSGRKKTS